MKRLKDNPLLTPQDVAPTREDLQVLCKRIAAYEEWTGRNAGR